MDSSLISCGVECVCSICQDLLTENPEVEPIPGPSQAKRPRTDSYSSQSPSSTASNDTNPQPSTSTVAIQDTATPELCTTPCGHVFHKLCLLSWINRKPECPTCRKKVLPVFQKKVNKLTRIFLPLTAGQCRNCKERVKQLEIAQLDYALEKSFSDVCRQKEKEWMDQCMALVLKQEKLDEQINLGEEQVEELQMQVEAGKVDMKLMERNILEEKLKSEEMIRALQEELHEQKKSEEELKQRCEQLETEKCNLEEELGEEKKKRMEEEKRKDGTPQWKDLYRVAVLEKEKFRSDRDYERGRAALWEEWYDQLRNHYEDKVPPPVHHMRTEEINRYNEMLIGNAIPLAITANVPMEKTRLSPITMKNRAPQLSDSEDDDDGYNTGYQEGQALQSKTPTTPSDVAGEDGSGSELSLSLSSSDEDDDGSSSGSGTGSESDTESDEDDTKLD